MPCSYFEPQRIAQRMQHQAGRLPLLDEYDGVCHAGNELLAAPPELRLRCCNQGYSHGVCQRYPTHKSHSGMRYSIIQRSDTVLDVLCIEEQDYTPIWWREVKYLIPDCRLEPEITDICMRAQVLAFCRSYLDRFGSD
jgi:hypothetical protein